jgi:hypothetical protein
VSGNVQGLQRKGYRHHLLATEVDHIGRLESGRYIDYSGPLMVAEVIEMVKGPSGRWDLSLMDDAFDWCRKACRARS